MKFKIKNEAVAKQYGLKKGAVVEVPEQQVEKWIRFDWGSEVKKEEKLKKETKELKIEKETKDATDQD